MWPVSTPTLSMLAIAGLDEVHIPPVPDVASTTVLPAQTVDGPDMVPAEAVTVTTIVTEQPLPRLYVINVVPGATPVTRPVVTPMVATDSALLAHVPPAGVLVSIIVLPTHTIAGPAIADGPGLTLTVLVAMQPPAA